MNVKTKKIVSGNKELNQKASERIATYIQDNVLSMGQNTSSIKFVNRVVKGERMSDSHLEFIMRILGQLRSQSNGSFSINLPSNLSEEQAKILAKATANVHGQMEAILNQVYDMLPDNEKEMGPKIQRQNKIRDLMVGKLVDVANAQERVDNYLREHELVYIPKGAYMELKIVGGALSFEEPQGQYWKEGPEVVVGKVKMPTWRSNWDLYGRTRLPLVTEEISQFALEAVFGLASSFEKFWEKRDIVDTDSIIQGFMEWSETLKNKDTEIKKSELTDEEVKELDRIASEYVKDMMQW